MTVSHILHFVDTYFALGKCTDKGIAVIELAVSIVVLVNFKGRSAELVVRIFLIHLSQGDVALNRLIDKAYACFIFNDIHLFIGVDEYGIDALIKQEPFGSNGFFHKVVTVVKVEHFIHTVFFGKCTDKFIALVNYSVCVVVLIDFKGCTGELIFRVVLIYLSQGNIAHNKLIDDFDFYDLSVLFDNHVKDCFIENKTDRLLNLTNYPLTIRNIGKRKTTIFCGSGSHQSGIHSEVGFVFLEQADYCTCKTVTVFGSFHTLNRTIDKVIFDRLAAVYRQGNGNDFLTFIFKGKLILIRVQDIMLIGCDFLYIVTADRKVGLNGCKSVLIKGNYFDKSVSRNGSTACGNKFFCGI